MFVASAIGSLDLPESESGRFLDFSLNTVVSDCPIGMETTTLRPQLIGLAKGLKP